MSGPHGMIRRGVLGLGRAALANSALAALAPRIAIKHRTRTAPHRARQSAASPCYPPIWRRYVRASAAATPIYAAPSWEQRRSADELLAEHFRGMWMEMP